uniref:Rubredoxin-like domain-containing protein n=1 Tax=Haptolina ericina TaxID=156174 RepID=A0A7S3EZP7_9EUKA
MAAAIKDFRGQLGPGKYRADMFQSFLVALASDVPAGVAAITNTKTVVSLMRIPDAQAAQALEGAAAELQKQPSVLGKLTFMAERAMPMASSMAKLRTRFPNWSLDTVTALQRAMLENLYRDLCDELPPDTIADSNTLEVLGLSAAEASRLMQEVQEKKAAAEAAALAEQEEQERAQQLQRAMEAASALSPSESRDDDVEDGGGDAAPIGAAGTHEYECTQCGYVLFPAAGRESKFFGDAFKCPQCGAAKSSFVDNGPV